MVLSHGKSEFVFSGYQIASETLCVDDVIVYIHYVRAISGEDCLDNERLYSHQINRILRLASYHTFLSVSGIRLRTGSKRVL